jgi:acyl-CoA synthetase (NDP forming)
MDCYGIPLLETRLATSVESAEDMARELGFPVVMKATRPGLVHKRELRGVHLGLSNESALREAYRAIARSLEETEPQVALQPMVPTGVELVVGVAHDHLFGSLVMVGLGGVDTDVLGDRSFRALPLTDRDAADLWRELRAAPLLTGYRGTPAMDTAALQQLLLRVAQLALRTRPESHRRGSHLGLRLSTSSSSCSRPRMNPTRTFGAWPFERGSNDCSLSSRWAAQYRAGWLCSRSVRCQRLYG